MASYTDAISQFNPYVAQLPVEAMVKVGMQKQAQYDQGVQKIQTYIDNVAGVDVIKPEHKQYLESKLNQLNGKLRTVAAGDFSNQQLVNSVSGMASQIIKDPTVQNAVYSTQKIRKGQQELEAAKKAGKSSKNNEDYFNNLVGNFLGDKNLESTFTGGYTQYSDYNAKLMDVAEKIKEIDNTVEYPYVRDAKGNTVLDAKGKPVIDMAMLAVTVKGKPAEKLLSAFTTTLNSNDEEQMKIDSWAKYRGATAATFAPDIIRTFDNKKRILSDEATNLTVNLKSSQYTTAEKGVMQARLNDLNAQHDSGELDKQMNTALESLKDPNVLNDNFKYEMFKQKHLTDLASDMSRKSYQYAYKTNPYFQAQTELQKLDMQAEQNRIENDHWLKTYNFNAAEAAYKHERDFKEDHKFDPKVTTELLPTDVDVPTLEKTQAKANAIQGNINVLNAEAAPIIVKGAINKQAALDLIYNNYLTNPNSVTGNEERQYAERRKVLEGNKAAENTLIKNISAQSKKFTDQINATLKSTPGVNFSNGTSMYNAKDLHDVASAYSRYTKAPMSGPGSPARPTFDYAGFMGAYRGTRLEPIAVAYAKNFKGAALSPTERVLLNKSSEIQNQFRSTLDKVYNDKLKFESESLLKYQPERAAQVGAIDPRNESDMASISQIISTKAAKYMQQGAADVSERGQMDPDEIAKMRKEGGVSYNVVKKYDGTAELHIISGTKQQIVPMTAGEVSTFFPSVAQTHPLTEAKYAIMKSVNKTTNSAGLRDNVAGAVTAKYSGYDLPQLANTKMASKVRYDIEGSSSNIGDSNDKFQVTMYAITPGGIWKPVVLNQAGYRSLDDIQLILDKVGTQTINEVLKSK